MVEKVLGLPHGTRPVVVISKHEESRHRQFYKTNYEHGRRVPIHYAATILEKQADLHDETFFRTFFLVALATHLTPGTGNMVSFEYLSSLEVASEVCEYAWGDQILKDVMTEIDTFQKKKKKKAQLDRSFKKIWVDSCLPLVATEENQDMHHEAPKFPIKHPEELPAFILPIIERHKAKWAHDISKATSRLTKLHAKRMNEFAQDFLAATKDYDPDPTNYSSPHRVLQDTHTEQPQSPGPKETPDTMFWKGATAYADEVEKSVIKTAQNNHDVASTSAPRANQSTSEEETRRRIPDSYEDPSFSILPPAVHAKAFTKLDFMKFTCFNPPDCPQQKTHFDCGIFTMLFMKQWDGKNMAHFSKCTRLNKCMLHCSNHSPDFYPQDTYDHRAIITELIITSQLNNQDPTWVLKTK
ncbi:hypothetical protein D1007_16461 [Hordeum vulgare]|nr:hypothetical protein D1007_16461 [Hordeum vulgare]